MSSKPIRAMVEVMDLPRGTFGTDKARMLRKLVLLAIASFANADGTEAYPSLNTIADRCDVTDRAVRSTITWLVGRRLLRVEPKAGRSGKLRGRTNKYSVLLRPAHPEIELPPVAPTSGSSEVTPGSLGATSGSSEVTPGNRKRPMTALRPSDRPITGRPCWYCKQPMAHEIDVSRLETIYCNERCQEAHEAEKAASGRTSRRAAR